MGGHPAQDYWEHAGLAKLIVAFLLAPFAWLLDLQISYASVKWTCENNARILLLLVPVGSLALIAIGTWLSWSCWAMLRDQARPDGGRMEDRSYFLALSGLALNAVFGLLILTSYAPRYFLGPCE